MRTDILAYIVGSANRKKILQTLFEYPRRQWACSVVEELTRLSHATVYRTLHGLRDRGLLKSLKVNKKDTIYQLVTESPLLEELKKALTLEAEVARKIARIFASQIQMKPVKAILLYGSTVRKEVTTDSDIDLLIVISSHNRAVEDQIQSLAATLSSQYNKSIAVVIMDIKEMQKEQEGQFLQSVQEHHEVLYGKTPF